MCDRVNKESCQIGHCRRCHSAACRQIPQNVTCWGSRAAQAPQSPRRIKPWQHMPTQFTMYTPDLEQSGQHNSIWALPGTQVSPWATLHHTDETGWHRCTNRPEEWAWQRAAMISSCHYLPGRSRVQPHRNMHATSTETLGADLKAMPSLSSMWLIVRWLDAVNWGDRNKRIRHPKKLGNVSVSIWVRQHKEAGDGDGGPLTFTNTCIGVQLVYWSWHWNNIPVAVHK